MKNIDIFYYSLTGNIRRFLDKVGENGHDINMTSPERPYILITNTLGFGEVPLPVQDFLKDNSELLVGVAASGNRNWGHNFAVAADIIRDEYSVPVLSQFELSGDKGEVDNFKEKIKEIDEKYESYRVE